MLVVGVLGAKGGCGKSQITTNLTVAFAQAGRKVGVLDVDPQATLEKWGYRRGGNSPLVGTATFGNLERKLRDMAKGGMDIVFIDTEGSLNQGTLTVAKFSDYIIIPCQPSLADLESVADSVNVVVNNKKPYSIILNRVSWLTKEGDEAEAFIRDADVPVAKCRIGERAAFRRALIVGKSVLEFEPNGQASQEIKDLYVYICKELNVPAKDELEEVA